VVLWLLVCFVKEKYVDNFFVGWLVATRSLYSLAVAWFLLFVVCCLFVVWFLFVWLVVVAHSVGNRKARSRHPHCVATRCHGGSGHGGAQERLQLPRTAGRRARQHESAAQGTLKLACLWLWLWLRSSSVANKWLFSLLLSLWLIVF
jgi:hypothetical protein